jgi:hypothetical protein
MNTGYSSRLPYDNDTYTDKIASSTYSVNYKINSNQISHNNKCRSKLTPRSGFMGHGVSVPNDLGYAESQSLVDIESIFSNRKTKTSKSKTGQVNLENPLTMFNLFDSKTCPDDLEMMYSLETHPPSNYRDMEVNRFYDIGRNPQNHIFEDFSRNTRLEAKDNYKPKTPKIWIDQSLPQSDPNFVLNDCTIYGCDGTQNSCPTR